MRTSLLLIILINSLTKAEKRFFHLYSNMQSGEKVYLSLFDMVQSDTTPESLLSSFNKSQNGRCFEASVKHLYNNILDCLVRLRDNQDIQTHIFNLITEANILYERGLAEAAISKLTKAKELARIHEKDTLLLLIQRTELKYLNETRNGGLSEIELTEKHVEINKTDSFTRAYNHHLQIYNILTNRYIHKSGIRSDINKKELYDLVLNELQIITNETYTGFEQQKLHLLFQATYYLCIGSHKSAVYYFHEIINLFNHNPQLMQNPPIYYLSALKGCVDSLFLSKLFLEVPFFISKLDKLALCSNYSSEFILEVETLSFIYNNYYLLNTGNFLEAQVLIKEKGYELLSKDKSLKTENQLSLYICMATLGMYTNDCSFTRKHLKKIFYVDESFRIFPLYRIARLMNLLLQAEIGNYDFIDNEILRIKRDIHYNRYSYATERIIFRFVHEYPMPSYEKGRNKMWSKYNKDIQRIREDKYERQILSVFDVASWIESKITGQALDKILSRNCPTSIL